MAVFDWNHNGKNDMQDDFLEYMIYNSITEESGSADDYLLDEEYDEDDYDDELF